MVTQEQLQFVFLAPFRHSCDICLKRPKLHFDCKEITEVIALGKRDKK